MIKLILRIVGIIVACITLLIGYEIVIEITGMDRISRDREAKMKPVIKYVEEFIKNNGRLPTYEEFHNTADKMAWMVVLRTKDHPYAARKGAKKDLDYMVGMWRADWYHYYKSWDHKFLNATDETLEMMNGH